MNWKVLANDSISRAFREAIKFYNSLWKSNGNGHEPPYVSDYYSWGNLRLVPGTNIIILIPSEEYGSGSVGPYGVIGKFDGWKSTRPMLFTFISELHKCLNVVSDDNYRTLVNILGNGNSVIVADYSILTTDIPDPMPVASKY